jgi:arylsulfatase A-like enzyme
MRVLFIVADSLRADALGCYGSVSSTPTIDGIASKGARFETVISSAPWTVPSLAAMLTGLWSHRLGVMKWEQPWPSEVPTIFSYFRQKKIETASFVFEPDHLFRSCPEAEVVGSSQDTDAMLAWFRQRREGDYFAFVHYWWTHVPYLRRKLPLPTWNKLCSQILALLSDPDPEQRLANRAQVKGLYALAVEEFSENWLPALLDAARADVVVIVSDHGESWGERLPGQQPLRDVFDLHGNHLHNEVLRVPWLLHAPTMLKPVVVKGLACTVDILPTLIELLNLGPVDHRARTPGSSMAGRALTAALCSGQIEGKTLAMSSRNHDFVDADVLPTTPAEVYIEFASQSLRKKVISNFGGDGAWNYDLADDPDEARPGTSLDSSGLVLLDALRSEMSSAVVAPHHPEDFSLMIQQLRNLGYL